LCHAKLVDECGTGTGPVLCTVLEALNVLVASNTTEKVYEAVATERVGGVEQTALIYDSNKLTVLNTTVYPNISPAIFARPPGLYHLEPVAPQFGGSFWLASIHTQPSAAVEEIMGIIDVLLYLNHSRIIFLGDFNADGSYFDEKTDWTTFYSRMNSIGLEDYFQAIDNTHDTTMSEGNSYTYDRILLSPALAVQVRLPINSRSIENHLASIPLEEVAILLSSSSLDLNVSNILYPGKGLFCLKVLIPSLPPSFRASFSQSQIVEAFVFELG
jgi:hypothetical protein